MNIAAGSIAFAAPLAALAFVMASGEPNAHPCAADLALEKSAEIVEAQPGVVGFALTNVRHYGCRLEARGLVDVRAADGFHRKPFKVEIAFDEQNRRWQEVSVEM